MLHRLLTFFKRGDYRKFLLYKLPKNSVGCEIGVWKGDFSEEILSIVRPQKLYLVDPWLYLPIYPDRWYGGNSAKSQKDMDDIYESVNNRYKHYENVYIVRKKTEDLTGEIPDGCLDWVYIDGNHQYEYVLKDLETFMVKVKENGIICGDDYDRVEKGRRQVAEAVNDFLKQGTCNLLWIKNEQFFLKKTAL